MKLNKVNKNGSLSIILPRSLTKSNHWQEGDEMSLLTETANSIVLSKDLTEKDDLVSVLHDLKMSLQSFDKLKDNIDNEPLKILLKQHLLSVIERI